MKLQSRWGKDKGSAHLLLKALFNLSHLAVRHEGCRKKRFDDWSAANQIVATWRNQAELNLGNFVEKEKLDEIIGG